MCCTMRRYAIIVGMISCFETMQSDWLTKDPVCFHFLILLRKYKLYPKILPKFPLGYEYMSIAVRGELYEDMAHEM